MAAVQRIVTGSGPATYTVVGPDHLPIRVAEDYLAFLRAGEMSPHTVRAYAAGLAAWFSLLEAGGHPWQEIPASLFGQFLAYLRTGDLPGTPRIGPSPVRLAASSVQLRAAAVLAFYRWLADAHGIDAPARVLFTASRRGRGRYAPLLTGIAEPKGSSPLFRVRSGPKSRTPLLSPDQVHVILDGCARQELDGAWPHGAGLRDRLLFATLAETGMRLGEALGLRHCDLHAGQGGTPFIDVVPRQDHPHLARVKGGRERRIYIGDDLEALYSEYVWQLVDAGADIAIENFASHFLFVNIVHGQPFAPIRPETVYTKVKSLTKQGGLPKRWTPHWLRHTHASALLLAGCPPHVVMRRLGHADVQTTLSHYGWVTEDAEMRTLADWRAFTSGWRGVFDG